MPGKRKKTAWLMTSTLKAVAGGVLLGVIAWAAFRTYQGPRIDTAKGEGGGLLVGFDDFIDVAYQIGGAVMPGAMEISLNGLNQIKKHEGFSHTVYQDSAGLDTIGYGHLLTPADKLRGLRYVTEAEAVELLASDVATAESAVNRLVKVPLTQNQFDALVSFVYNVGAGAFSRSTMLKKLNSSDYAGAADQFHVWRLAGGRVVQGLVNRRASEASLFSSSGVA